MVREVAFEAGTGLYDAKVGETELSMEIPQPLTGKAPAVVVEDNVGTLA